MTVTVAPLKLNVLLVPVPLVVAEPPWFWMHTWPGLQLTSGMLFACARVGGSKLSTAATRIFLTMVPHWARSLVDIFDGPPSVHGGA